jgi:hypothetical protein
MIIKIWTPEHAPPFQILHKSTHVDQLNFIDENSRAHNFANSAHFATTAERGHLKQYGSSRHHHCDALMAAAAAGQPHHRKAVPSQQLNMQL